MDVSGRIVAKGEQVSDFQVGDRVFGIGSGTLAEYAIITATKLAHLPAGLDAQVAAAIPISGITALFRRYVTLAKYKLGNGCS